MTSAAARKKSISSSHFPTLAFGNPARQEDCLRALNLGFRLIDTATMYERATGLGSAISASSLTRSDVVVVTKIWPREIYPTGQIEPALRESLSRMQIEYVDYLLIHWPFAALPDVHAPSSQEGIRDLFADGNLRRTWRELERLVEEGLVRQLGVSNFGLVQLQELLALNTTVKPSVLQTEMHPLFHTPDIVALCRSAGIRVMAYSPMAWIGESIKLVEASSSSSSSVPEVEPQKQLYRCGKAMRELAAQIKKNAALKDADNATVAGLAVVAWLSRHVGVTPIVRSSRDNVLNWHQGACKYGTGAIVPDTVVVDAARLFGNLRDDKSTWQMEASKWNFMRASMGQKPDYMYNATALRSCRGAPNARPIGVGDDDEPVSNPSAYPETMLRASTANVGCLSSAEEALLHTRRVMYAPTFVPSRKSVPRGAAKKRVALGVVKEKSNEWIRAASDGLTLAIARYALKDDVVLVRAEALIVQDGASAGADGADVDERLPVVLRAIYNLGPGRTSTVEPQMVVLELARRGSPWHEGWTAEGGNAVLVCFEYARRVNVPRAPTKFAADTPAAFARLTATERAITDNRYLDEVSGVVVHPSRAAISNLVINGLKDQPLTMKPLNKTAKSKHVPWLLRLCARHAAFRPGDRIAMQRDVPTLAVECAKPRLKTVVSALMRKCMDLLRLLWFAFGLYMLRQAEERRMKAKRGRRKK